MERLPALVFFAGAFSLLCTTPSASGKDANAPVTAAPAPVVEFGFTLGKSAMASAGVFDANDRLLRVLWTMKNLPAGRQVGQWDGRDELGEAAPAGEYRYRVVVNRATYSNVGAIGNSGRPPNTANHIPTGIWSVAVDANGGIYTANGWDEAGADFKKWDPDGNSVYDARYQIRNGQPNGAPHAIAVDDEHVYCAMGGWTREPWNAMQQVQRFQLGDGKHVKFTEVDRKDGHINVYEWPEKLIPPNTPKADAELMKLPLRALAVSGDSILVADALGGRVLRYHKVTGKPLGEFPVKLPRALAVDASGRIWVGHEHHVISVFSADGKGGVDLLSDLGEVEAIAFGPNGRCYVADSGAGQVKVYDVSGAKPRLERALGRKAQPGDRAAEAFYELRGVAVDRGGHVVTIQREPAGGARLARWSPEGKLLWEHFGNEFVSLGNYGSHDPDTFYTFSFHRYRLMDRAAGAWEYANNALGCTRKYSIHPHGVPRVLRLGRGDFVFLPTGDGVQAYRVDGNVLRLASILGAGWPDPNGDRSQGKEMGLWSWHDAKGTGEPAAEEIAWFKRPPERVAYSVFGVDVDAGGNVWFANTATNSIWTVPMGDLDGRGNPTYDWAKAQEVVAKDSSFLKFKPTMAQHADDGSIYAFGWSDKWPQPKNNPFWMGGTTLVRFDRAGRRLWAVALPEVCVGLDSIPGGGCVAGGGRKAGIYHYLADGLLVGVLSPGEAMCKQSGWMDNHASVAVNRDARDRILDVFAEDDYVLRIGWYRVDDRDIQVITGAVQRP